MCTLLVTLTGTYLVSVGEMAWFLMHTLLVTQPVACLVSESELAVFFVCTCLVIQPILFQTVSLAFNVHSSGDTDCALSCFRW